MELNQEVVCQYVVDFLSSILSQLGQVGLHKEPVLLRRLVKHSNAHYRPDGHCNCMEYKQKGKAE